MNVPLSPQKAAGTDFASSADPYLEKISPEWRANLQLGFRKTPSKTILAERLREGPLSVQRAFYPEGDLCHIYLLHPPGGVAGGDQLNIQVHVAPSASALITTPGAGKFYRSIGPIARQQQTLRIDGGTLEWLPQENIFFPDANVELETRIELNNNARFIGWEINCLGQPLTAERFLSDHSTGHSTGRVVFNLKIIKDGLPLLIERLPVTQESDLSSKVGLRNNPVFGCIYATLDNDELLDSLRAVKSPSDADQLALTIVDGLLVVRYLGDSVERARHCFIKLWKILRPAVLNRPACPPRIWNT